MVICEDAKLLLVVVKLLTAVMYFALSRIKVASPHTKIVLFILKCIKMPRSVNKTQNNWCKTSIEHQKL
jgi:hypothetical protein